MSGPRNPSLAPPAAIPGQPSALAARALAPLCLALAVACGGAPTPKAAAPVAAPAIDPASVRPRAADIGAVRFPTPTVSVVGGGVGGAVVAAESGASGAGVELIVAARRTSPSVYFRWLIPGGKALEHGNEGRNRLRFPPGTIELMAELLTEGTMAHRGERFAAALERHGADVDVSAAADAVIVSGRVLSHQLAPTLQLVGELFTAPEFDAKLLTTRKAQHAASLADLASRPQAVAGRIFNRVVYGPDHPYGSPGLNAQSLSRITRAHLVEAHRAAFAAGGSSLVLVGDVSAEDAALSVQKALGVAAGRRAEGTGAVPAVVSEAEACHVYDVKDAAQSVVVYGNPGPERKATAWPQLVVANQILGGSASSRLFTVLRERKGLTYGIYSSLDGRLRAGDWSLSGSVRTPKTAEALDAIEVELSVMRSSAPSEAELAAARRFLVGQFVLGAADASQVASRLAAVRLYGLPESTWDRYAEELQRTDADTVRALSEKTFFASGRQIVVAGDLAALRPALDDRCPRIDLRDVDGERLRTLVGPDAAMTDADREALFQFWGKGEGGEKAIARFAADTSHAPAVRAALLDRLRQGPHRAKTLALGAKASDWRAVATVLVERLLPLLRDEALDEARSAKAMLLDLLAPTTGTSPLEEPVRQRAAAQLVTWAFAGVGVDSGTAAVQELVTPRLEEGDLPRLGPSAITGLEALVSADVFREAAALALIGLGDGASVRALVRAYRRVLVVRRVLPSKRDLELLARVPDAQTALVLLDCHALLELADREQEGTADSEATATRAQARKATMATLRGVIDAMSTATTQEAGGSRGSVLDRDIRHLQAHLEALLEFRDADDRWWAATLLVRHKGGEGLRIVLTGLSDDQRYVDPAWHTVPVQQQILGLCEAEIAPLGAAVVRPQLFAALAGGTRIAKVLSVATIRIWGDDDSITALRTHQDPADVASVLGLDRPTSVTDLAKAAVDANRLIRRWDEEARAGRMDPSVFARRRKTTLSFLTLTGSALEAAVERSEPKSAPAQPPAAKPPAAGASAGAGSGG